MKHWTDDIEAEAVGFFDSLPEREIRRRQTLCSAQVQIARARCLGDAVADLRRMEEALAASMMRRLL